jgi:hypothetical protein
MPEQIFLRKGMVFGVTDRRFNSRQHLILSGWTTVSDNGRDIHKKPIFSEACGHGRSFAGMTQVVLVHPLQTFTVETRLIVFKCDAFFDNPGLAASPYDVRSPVSLACFGEFVSALEGNTIKITNDNFKGLSALCDEFRFRDLAAALSQFRDSNDFKEAEAIKDSEARRRLSVLEERVQQRDSEIESLQLELLRRLQAQEWATKGAVERMSRLEADHAVVGSLSTEEDRLKELQSQLSGEVKSVGQELREAKESADNAKNVGLASRAVAEEAQKTGEAHLARMSRLEANLLSRRSGPVPAETNRPATARKSSASRAPPSRAPPSRAPARKPSPEAASSTVPVPVRPMSPIAPAGWNSAIVRDFPKIFECFKQNHFTLLWRGSRDGFRPSDFHKRCDAHPNTMTVIMDTDGNVFGGCTPVRWESRTWNGKYGKDNNCYKGDQSLKSFLFTLKNPHNVPARRFALKAEGSQAAIFCECDWGPSFVDIYVADNCNTDTRSYICSLGQSYINDTGLQGNTFFTGSKNFQVKEIEVFEIRR